MQVEKILCKAEHLIEVRNHLRRQGTYFLMAGSTISVPAWSVKYMDSASVRNWPNLDGEQEPMTPGEAARTELKREFPDLRRVGWRGPMIKLFDMRPPMCYSGQFQGEMAYYDLKSAYWQIYRYLWLDQLYPGGFRGRYPLIHIAARLQNWKPARNAVVGISRARYVYGDRAGKRIKISFTNHFLSPGLWATVMAYVQWIAAKAIELGAFYVNTDGYIFSLQNQRGIDTFKQWCSDRALELELRAEGEGEIVSWNNYRIEGFETKPYRLKLKHSTKEFSNVGNDKDWTRHRFICRELVLSGGTSSDRNIPGRQAYLYQDHAGE